MDKQLRPQVSNKTTSREQEDDAFAHLTPLVHRELRRLEQRYLQREQTRNTVPSDAASGALASRTTRPGAITGGAIGSRYVDQKHFFTVCARQMRRTLVDHATGKEPEQGNGSPTENQTDTSGISATGASALLALDHALMQFEQVDSAASLAFELYYFGGHDYKELAVITRTSEVSVRRQLRLARAWLLAKLTPNH